MHSQYVVRAGRTRATPAAGVRRPGLFSSSKSPSPSPSRAALRDRLCLDTMVGPPATNATAACPVPFHRRRPASIIGSLSDGWRCSARNPWGTRHAGVDPMGWHTWTVVGRASGAGSNRPGTRVWSERVDRARRFDRRNRLPPVGARRR
jgi:hypothetical protein